MFMGEFDFIWGFEKKELEFLQLRLLTIPNQLN